MKIAPLPSDEKERLVKLENYRILDSIPEQDFDDLTFLASHICKVPIALISLVDKNRQWFKSKIGLNASETSRDLAFCSHAILQEEVFIIPDSLKDERFHDNPLATGAPNVRFYAGAPLQTSSGHRIGTLCVIDNIPRDLTLEQIKALQALARQVISQLELRLSTANAENAIKTKSAFFANISHEIRTPMNGIIGMTNLLLDALVKPANIDKLKIIQNCSNSLLDLINDILDFSKLEVDKVELEINPFSLQSLVKEIVELLNVKASEKGITLSYQHNSSIPLVLIGDRMRIRQILMNLVSNALKFTAKGNIEILSQAILIDVKKWKISLSVRDSGIGISEDVINKLFVSFSQADASTTRKYGGSGLGLAISKRLCEKMGGTIWVESSVGKGSTFSFTFIAEEGNASQIDLSENPTPIFDPKMGLKLPLSILIAEDNHTNQLVVSGFLAKLGYQAAIVNNGKEVLESLEHNSYDLILMDCHMPEMDGFEATKEILLKYKDSKIPRIIALTASAMKEDIEQCFASGMNGFLGKPITMPSLIDIINRCTSNQTPLEIENTKLTEIKSTPTSFNKKAFLGNYLGMEDFSTTVIMDFLIAIPKLVSAVETSLQNKDPYALEIAAHTLVGALSNFFAESAISLAKKLEKMGHDKSIDNSMEIFQELSSKISILKYELRELINKEDIYE
ncbi:GAF domain-containing hybrid sensor histidine kinase/response regulator [Fluviispira sanaruensis]|uniref:Sensory/regulatory protein RpfC n=1 Tax=Fluviispira sanaruensis TaxID=2493639 RepID=A0A4P2VMM3_FLUSA|nr:GAF domain-containing hybrid sensor histidine kinase/response regulator [Fluviispira sanaruensis]BBH54653.1 hybrid sensor histidine kinase/response regulator [Fluviispira sanaruensis]